MNQKTNLRILLLCFCFSLIQFRGVSQIWLEDEAIYNEAETFLSGEEFEEALPLYQLLEKKGILNSNISYKIGACYLNILGKKSQAIPYLESAIENVSSEYSGTFLEKNAPTKAYFLLGKAYRVNYQFDKAIQSFEKFKELNPGSDFEQLANFELKKCRTAEAMLLQPSGSVTELIADNSTFSLYNPVSIPSGKIYFMEKRQFYDAVIQANISSGIISNAENITPALGSDGDFILSSITDDGTKMILTSYQAGNGYELYEASLAQDGLWGKVKKFPEPINSVFNETSASYSSYGNTLYFCSNRNGGEGGSDIYMSKKLLDGSWDIPINLGNKINTPMDEEAVFINSDGTHLFFSSQGHLNMGGYDLFVAASDAKGGFGIPVNLGSPVSTPDDDKFISTSGNSDLAYIYKFDSKNSDRYQIYKVEIDKNSVNPKLYIQGKLAFTDAIPQKPVRYDVIDSKNEQIVHNSTTPTDGTYSFIIPSGTYKIHFIYNDEIQATQTIVVDPQSTIDELNVDAPIWKTTTKNTAAPEVTIIHVPDILFLFDSYTIQPNYFTQLDSLVQFLKKFDKLTIIVSGHTDALGSDPYNQILSLKRAQSVKEYFTRNGIKVERITCVGKGRTAPIAIDKNSNGTDNAKGRTYNRRVSIEVKVQDEQLKIINSDSVPEDLKLPAIQ